MKFSRSLTFQLAAVLSLSSTAYGSIRCHSSMAPDGSCIGFTGENGFGDVEDPSDCLGVPGQSAFPIDFPFYTDVAIPGDGCHMTPNASPLGDCCLEGCDDCPLDYTRRNPENCPDGYGYFMDFYLQMTMGLPPAEACRKISDLVTMEGDPHVKTFGGTWFDYHGECDLVLVHVPDFDGKGVDMNIHARTKIRHGYSYIEAAALNFGDDVLEVNSFGSWALNEIDNPTVEEGFASVGGYKFYHTQVNEKKHTFDVVLGPKENITITTYKDLVSVSLTAGAVGSKYFRNTQGLMGSFKGTLLARDGETVMDDMNAFGQEWQVQPEEPKLFRNTRAPQYPQKCILPASPAVEQRRLGETIAKKAAEQACGHLSGKSFDNCVLDVMALGDLDVANAGTF